jgi:hypothetical protein
MKRSLLFVFIAFVAFPVLNAQTVVYSDDFQGYSDGYDITLEDMYSIAANKTKSAIIVKDSDDANNLCVEISGLDDGTHGLTFKIGSGAIAEGFTEKDNGNYTFKGRVKSELGGKVKLTIYGTADIENLENGSTLEKTWTEVTTTFTINTQDTIYPTFVVYSYKNQKVYFDDVQLIKEDATSIRKVNNVDVSIYPNPVCNAVIFNGTSDVRSVEINDITGRKAISVNEVSGNRLDVSGLKNGIYIMKVTTDNGVKVLKFLKR